MRAIRPCWSDRKNGRNPGWTTAIVSDARCLAVLKLSTAAPILQTSQDHDEGHLVSAPEKNGGLSIRGHQRMATVIRFLKNVVTRVTGLVGSRAARSPVFGPTENNDARGLVDPDCGTTEACLSSAKTPAHGGREPRQAERERQENQLPQMGG